MEGRKDYRSWISADGSTGFRAEKDRYHLYVGLGCPFAHRALIVRALKGLDEIVSMSVLSPTNTDFGWKFDPKGDRDNTVDHLFGKTYLRDIYLMGDEKFSGRITVPLLFDKVRKVPVNNDSAEIVRMFNKEFNHLIEDPRKANLDLYPESNATAIDATNDVLGRLRSSASLAGAAVVQEDYERAARVFFNLLDELEVILAKNRYLNGNAITESDIHYFVVLVRFDIAYYFKRKLNLKKIADYPNTSNYLKDLFRMPAFGDTTNFNHIKKIYFTSDKTGRLPPPAISPIGPIIDYNVPHNRSAIGRKDFRSFITADGQSGFKAEKDRYHLFVSLGCPFAQRAAIVRVMKGLEDIIPMSVVSPIKTDLGYKFDPYGHRDNTVDHVYGKQYLRDYYLMGDPEFRGVITVPLLFDKIKKVPVSNESAEIVRMFNKQFNHLIEDKEKAALDLYPEGRSTEIDAMNTRVLEARSFLYKAGSSRDQASYDEALKIGFKGLDDLEKILKTNRYLNGSSITESDIYHFVTLIRFESATQLRLRLTLRNLDEYPNTINYLRDLYQTTGFGDTTNFDHIKLIAFCSEKTNQLPDPSIVPAGAIIKLGDHNRVNMN